MHDIVMQSSISMVSEVIEMSQKQSISRSRSIGQLRYIPGTLTIVNFRYHVRSFFKIKRICSIATNQIEEFYSLLISSPNETHADALCKYIDNLNYHWQELEELWRNPPCRVLFLTDSIYRSLTETSEMMDDVLECCVMMSNQGIRSSLLARIAEVHNAEVQSCSEP